MQAATFCARVCWSAGTRRSVAGARAQSIRGEMAPGPECEWLDEKVMFERVREEPRAWRYSTVSALSVSSEPMPSMVEKTTRVPAPSSSTSALDHVGSMIPTEGIMKVVYWRFSGKGQ
eukprot:Amastigsp_a175493_95.p5 type:complete len:118 gc:universal Amastigsp_a175493_95:556-203(-)